MNGVFGHRDQLFHIFLFDVERLHTLMILEFEKWFQENLSHVLIGLDPIADVSNFSLDNAETKSALMFDGVGAYSVVRGGASPATRSAVEALLAAQGI